MKRALEPEAENPRDEAIAYQEMDHRSVNDQFVADLFDGGCVGPRVLDLGCGPALIPILICERADAVDQPGDQAPRFELMGVDHCMEMLQLAQLEVEFSGRVDQVLLQQVDLMDDEGMQESIADTVISNTVMHHLSDPACLLRLAVRAARQGSRIFIRDLFRPAEQSEVERLVREHAGEADSRSQQLLRQSLQASLTLDEVREMASDIGIESQCIQMTSDRHWTLDWTVAS